MTKNWTTLVSKCKYEHIFNVVGLKKYYLRKERLRIYSGPAED